MPESKRHTPPPTIRILSALIGLSLCILLTFCPAGLGKQVESTTRFGQETRVPQIYLTEIDMRGVGCLGCVRRIEKALKRTTGVLKADVTYEHGKGATARIIYDKSAVELSHLLQVIQQETRQYKVRLTERAKLPSSATDPCKHNTFRTNGH